MADIETNLPVSLLSSHPAVPTALARTFDIRNAGNAELGLAEVTYSSKPLGERQSATFDNSTPTDPAINPAAPTQPQTNDVAADARPMTLKVTNWTEAKVLAVDATTGDRVVNSAGDSFDPPAKVDQTHYAFQFSCFRLPANLNWYAREVLMDTVNDRTWTILGRPYHHGSCG